jgi:hypothetical protein
VIGVSLVASAHVRERVLDKLFLQYDAGVEVAGRLGVEH